MRKPLIDGNLKRWNNKKEKYLVFYIITRWKLGNSYTNWNVFLVFSRIWLAIVRSPDRCETAPNRTFLNASSVGFGRIELYYTFRGWRYDRAELDGRRRIIDNIFRVLIYMSFLCLKMPYYNHKHFSSSILIILFLCVAFISLGQFRTLCCFITCDFFYGGKKIILFRENHASTKILSKLKKIIFLRRNH